jgi:hypothetical protein
VIDVSLQSTAGGKFTFAWGADGDLVFDAFGAYPLFSTLNTHKGRYYWDATGLQGTLLYQVKQDRLRTGSQLVSYSRDAIDQCKAAGIISDGTPTAERKRTGVYRLKLQWQAGNATKSEVLEA